jgi:hypothetical protein
MLASPCVNSRDSRSEIEHLYQVLNRERFSGALPRYRIRLMRRRADSHWPLAGSQIGACNHEYCILWVDSGLSGEGLHRVLLHEMCHIATRDEARLHGPRFLACLRAVATDEPWLADEAAMYEDRIPDYPPGLEAAVVVRMIVDSLAHHLPDKQWRRVRRLAVSKADMTDAAFAEAFPQAAAWWRQAARRERWLQKASATRSLQ